MKKAFALLCAAVLAVPVTAQEKAAEKKKMERKKAAVAHKKATPEQIRKFNDLEKKRQK